MKKNTISLSVIILAVMFINSLVIAQNQVIQNKVTQSSEALQFYETYFLNTSNILLFAYEYDLSNNLYKQNELKNIIEEEGTLFLPIKGEYEKEEDYNRRIRKYNESIKKISNAKSTLETLKKTQNILLNNISQEEVYISKLEPPKVHREKISSISNYNSESEYFIVELNGSKHYVHIPINDAQDFKSKYHDIEILEFPNNLLKFVFNKHVCDLDNILVDNRDGNAYKITIIGKQIWMAENLYYKTKYGSSSRFMHPSKAKVYKMAYNWKAAKEACPVGWHLPMDSEWEILQAFSGGKVKAGGKLKEQGTIHWSKPNIGATNETGFSALPGGYAQLGWHSSQSGNAAYFYSATENSNGKASYWHLKHNSRNFSKYHGNKAYGMSVRCIKD